MGNAVLAADYQPDPTDIRPAADPHVVSDVQRIMQALEAVAGNAL